MAESQASGRSPLRLALQGGAVLLVTALLGLLVWKIANKQKAEAKVNKPAPTFTLPRVDRPGTLSLASLRGHPVVLNFWASWCAPCRDEAPALEAAWRKWRPRGLVVLGIDGSDDFTGDAKAFIRKHDLTYPAVRDSQLRTFHRYGVAGYPETFFVNRRGKLVEHVIGQVKSAELAAGIRKALE